MVAAPDRHQPALPILISSGLPSSREADPWSQRKFGIIRTKEV